MTVTRSHQLREIVRQLLEEGTNRLALDPKADHPRAVVDLLDRVGGNEPPAAREESGADRKRIGLFGRGAVHRALDPANHPALRIGDEESSRPTKIEGKRAHVVNLFPLCKENPLPRYGICKSSPTVRTYAVRQMD